MRYALLLPMLLMPTLASGQTMLLGVAPDNPPTNIVAPVASGETDIGHTLGCTTGTWRGLAETYAYQWQADASDIVGATSETYDTTGRSAGEDITCLVTGSNFGGSSSPVASNAITLTAAGAVPTNSVAPVISGTLEVGSVLSCTTGTWTGTPTSYAYQWKVDSVSSPGETNNTYNTTGLSASDVITCVVTASNAEGAGTPATSNELTLTASQANPIIQAAASQILADEGSLNFTPTLTQGSGTWTFADLPTGASGNSSTGALTGTLSTPGQWLAKATCTNTALEYDYIYVPVSVRTNAVTIDAAWITAEGSTGPFFLDQADTTYTLDVDVTVDGIGFVFGAKNVTFDLNGHTITYGNEAAVVVTNGDFETGSGTTVTGWDLTNAPSATLASNDVYLFDAQVLKFVSITGEEYIQSDPITITQANHEHKAAIVVDGPYTSQAKIVVMDDVTETQLGATAYADTNHGYAHVVTFTPTTTNDIYLKIYAKPAAGQTQTVSIDYATVTASGDYGIIAAGLSSYLSSHALANSTIVAACTAVGSTNSNIVIDGGTIAQGAGNGADSPPIICDAASQMIINDVTATWQGPDTAGIRGGYCDHTYIINSDLTSSVDVMFNRTNLNAASIGFSQQANDAVFMGNAITDSPGVGVFISPCTNLVIRENAIASNTIHTDGYGILTNGIHSFEISYNTITAVDGKSSRGILLDSTPGITDKTSTNGEVFGNYVDILERPNPDYGAAMEATALRMRSGTDGCYANVSIHDNTFIARCDTTHTTGAYGGRLAYFPASHLSGDLGWTLTNNTFKAIVGTASGSYQGRALSFDAVTVDGHGITATGNTLESNDCSLGFGSNDGQDSKGVTCIDNTLVKSAEGTTRTHYSMRSAYYTGVVDNVVVQDSAFSGGAANNIDWIGSGVKDISLVWTITVTVTAGGSPVSGATVTLEDSGANELDSDTTDANGQVTLSTTDTLAHGDTPLALAGCVVTATKAGYTGDSDTVTLVSTRTLSLTLVAE